MGRAVVVTILTFLFLHCSNGFEFFSRSPATSRPSTKLSKTNGRRTKLKVVETLIKEEQEKTPNVEATINKNTKEPTPKGATKEEKKTQTTDGNKVLEDIVGSSYDFAKATGKLVSIGLDAAGYAFGKAVSTALKDVATTKPVTIDVTPSQGPAEFTEKKMKQGTVVSSKEKKNVQATGRKSLLDEIDYVTLFVELTFFFARASGKLLSFGSYYAGFAFGSAVNAALKQILTNKPDAITRICRTLNVFNFPSKPICSSTAGKAVPSPPQL
eukprot:CAMPEP_0117765318 /NCGR_PEP_ID=MMETSP0947-20121206/20033_1 /TAXON_ID=44440 /ORGANISM="Chattonella subsalsa, Strain CCMP2191" /LENGTH=269 /DNA_ID=CAMNT_0005587935 /DNA_START=59 /DNA_END=868 /DNA_ORIENTATION=-